MFPVGFQSQVFWGLISPVQDLELEIPDVGLKSLTHQGTGPYLCDAS